MAGFRKAKAEQSALKMGLYGAAGAGKSFTALLMAEGLANLSRKRIAYVDTEHGTDFYCQTVPSRHVHPGAFDFDAIYTRSITEVISAVKGLDPTQYGVVIIDSISHLWEAAIAGYGGKLTKVGTIPIFAWGKIKKPYKELMTYLLSSPMHMIICGRQANVVETDEETEDVKIVGLKMRAEPETPYEPHILIRMEAIKPKKSNEIADIVAYIEKDRTGVLAGRSFINPNFDSLCKPILGLLGSVQAQMPTTDETAATDAEALAEQDQARAQESKSTYDAFAARIILSKSVEELKSIGGELTPRIKSKMGPDDVAMLREKYLEKERELSGRLV